MAAKTRPFWTFILILVLLHLVLRLAFGLDIIPDLLVVALLLGARRLGGWPAALLGLVLGILADSLALVGFGATAVAFVVGGYVGSRTRNLFEGDSYLFVTVYAFLTAWLIEVVRFLTGGQTGRGVPLSTLVTDAPLTALSIAIAAVVSLIAYRGITGNR